jgi:hypothetical protein
LKNNRAKNILSSKLTLSNIKKGRSVASQNGCGPPLPLPIDVSWTKPFFGSTSVGQSGLFIFVLKVKKGKKFVFKSFEMEFLNGIFSRGFWDKFESS